MMAWSRCAAFYLPVLVSLLLAAPSVLACSDHDGFGAACICGLEHAGSPSHPAQLPPPEPGVVDIAMVDFTYFPETVEVTPGTVVRWTNLDSSPHDTVSTDAKWQSEYLEPGGSFEYLFTDDSFQDFNYYCTLHGGMTGTVTVVLPEPAAIAVLAGISLAAGRRNRS